MTLVVTSETERLALARTRKPAEIYRFWNTNNVYYYTSSDTTITYDGNDYTPALIKRTGTRQSLDLTVSKVTLNIDYSQPVVSEFLGQSPLDLTFMEIKRVFRDQTVKEGLAVFIGVINGVSFQGMQCRVDCLGIEKLLRQKVPRLRYQAKCQLTLYGTMCGVTPATYGVTGTVVSVASNGLSFVLSEASAYADDYFNLGYAEKSGSPAKMIVDHSGSTILLRQVMVGLVASDTITIYPGCDKLMSTCSSKFNNLGNDDLDRFLGYPYIPDSNPAMWKG
jgi:uncharacterized phage protein (TIGR02218 family)